MQLTITQPDDWHLHLRDGVALITTVPHTAAQFARALIMPNLKTPVTSVAMAREYRQRILAALPDGSEFEPMMTLYLTESTSTDEVALAAESDIVKAFKYYPAGATTNSESGVHDLEKIHPLLEKMQSCGLVLCLHGEVVDSEVDIFDREKVFIERSLAPLVETFPRLRIVLEHITTSEATEFVRGASDNVAATITPQHLLYGRNALFQGGIRPHYYCLPVLKHERHRRAVEEVALSANPRFFLGTDSAPHSQLAKENACGCAGVYSAHAALALYAEFFEQRQALEKLEAFASHFGANFYRVPRNQNTVTLEKSPWRVPTDYPLGEEKLIPFRSGETLQWTLRNGIVQ